MSFYTSAYSTVFQDFSSAFFAASPAYNDTDVSNEPGRDMSRIGTWQLSTDCAAGGAKSKVYVYYWTQRHQLGWMMYITALIVYTFNDIHYMDYEANITGTEEDLQIEATMSE